MTYRNLLVESRNQIGIIWMNQADRGNTIDETMLTELTDVMHTLNDDLAVRFVILAAAGEDFCKGIDQDWFQQMPSSSYKRNHAIAVKLATLLESVRTLGKPTIARVHGPVLSYGAGLVAACDMAVGSFGAEFCLSDVRTGMIPSVISPYLIRAMGERAARHYCLSAERFTAAEAYRTGLLTDIAPLDELDARINELLGQLIQGAPTAQALTKEWIRAAAGLPFTTSLFDDAAKRHAAVCASDEARDGVDALLHPRRKPAWLRKTKKPAHPKQSAL